MNLVKHPLRSLRFLVAKILLRVSLICQVSFFLLILLTGCGGRAHPESAARNAKAPSPNEAFLQAAQVFGDTNMMKQAIAAGADLNVKTDEGMTALTLASRDGRIGMAKLLIAARADVNAKDGNGSSALTYVATDKQIGIARALLVAGAEVNAVDSVFGVTPLIRAAAGGQVELVSLLLEKDANLEAKDPFGDTAIMKAAKFGQRATVEFLRKAGAHYVPDLFTAAALGDVATLEELLAKGVDVDSRDKDTQTALMLAAATGQAEAVRILLDHGADVNGRNDQPICNQFGCGHRWTPLMRAAAGGHIEIVKALMAKGADVRVADDRRRTALSYAFTRRHFALVKLLVDASNEKAKRR